MKRRWKILIVVAAAVLAAVVVLVFSLDAVAKAGLEKGATAALGTRTAVSGLDLSLLAGSLDISQLTVANPQGFPGGNLMELREAAIGLSVGSLLSDTVAIRHITLDGPVLKIVRKGRETNLSRVLKNADEFAGGPEREKNAGGQIQGKKLRIDLVRITNARFEYRLAGAPAVKIRLPDIELKNLSDEKGKPLLIADVFAQVMISMTTSALKHPDALLPRDLAGVLEDASYGGKKIGEVLEAATETIKGAEEAVKSVGDLLVGLGRGRGQEEKKTEEKGQ